MGYVNHLISVIIPVYNAERYISQTLDSVIQQDYPDKEVILVDDCSTDRSAEIIKEYMNRCSYIQYYRLDRNSGVAMARNTGIKLAKGRFIAFVDSDDVWKEGKLSRQVAMFENRNTPPTCLTYTAINYIDEQGKEIKGKRDVKEKVTYSYLLRNTMIATSTVMIDRNVAPVIEMPDRRSAEDYSLWLTLLRDYGPAYGINEAYTSYRISPTQVSHNRVGEVKYFYQVQTEDLRINKIAASFNTICYIINAVRKHFL